MYTASSTCVAFLGNAFSEIMPIRSFGIYAGLIIPINFILVLCVFPSATIIYENYLSRFCSCRIDCFPNLEDEQRFQVTEMVSMPVKKRKTCNQGIEKFFGGKWSNMVRIARYYLFIIALGWFGFAVW